MYYMGLTKNENIKRKHFDISPISEITTTRIMLPVKKVKAGQTTEAIQSLNNIRH